MSAEQHENSPLPDATLLWSATRYVLGEMEDTERDAWEEVLLGDAVACAAVAEATRLVLGLAFACSEGLPHANPISQRAAQPVAAQPRTSGSTSRSHTSRAFVALATSLAATLLVAFAGVFSGRPGGMFSPTPEQQSAARLVGLWQANSPLAHADFAARHDFADQPEWSEGVLAEEVPNWLLAAVSLEASRAESDDVWEDN